MIAAVLATFPAPPGSEISIGPLDLRAYGVMIALGVIAAVWLCGRRFEQRGIGTTDDVTAIAVWAVLAGVIGARLYHVATDWQRFEDDLAAIPKIWEGGLGVPGGMLAGVLVGVYLVKRRGIDVREALGAAAPALPLAQAIGRWGNWFNQELFGRPTDLPWALEVDPEHIPSGYEIGTTFHPTFLYESLWNLALVGLLLVLDRRVRLAPVRLFAVYVVGYGVGRLWIESLRIDPANELAGLRVNVWMSLVLIAAGSAYLVATHGRRRPDAGHRTDEPPPTPAATDTDDASPPA